MVQWLNYNQAKTINPVILCALPRLHGEDNTCYVARVHLAPDKLALGYYTKGFRFSPRFYFTFHCNGSTDDSQYVFKKELLVANEGEKLTWKSLSDPNAKVPKNALQCGLESGQPIYACLEPNVVDEESYLFKALNAEAIGQMGESGLAILVVEQLNGEEVDLKMNDEEVDDDKMEKCFWTQLYICCYIAVLFGILFSMYLIVYFVLILLS